MARAGEAWRPVAPALAPAVATARGRGEVNQDRACALRTLVGGEAAVLLAAAHGTGGPPAGEQAADLALEVVCRFAQYVIPDTDAGPELAEALADMLRAAGRRIWLWDHEHGGRAGSTLACALVWGHRYLSARIGDGRSFRVDGGGAALLTPDDAHSRAPRVLGTATDPVIQAAPPDGQPGALRGDGIVLLCSDGLRAAVDEHDVHAAVHETRVLEDACRRLLSLAAERGSTDNLSVAAVEVGAFPRRSHRA